MISNALFPCMFTDGARVVGELSYTLNSQVCNDSMIIADLADELMISSEKIRKKLFTRTHPLSRTTKAKEALVGSIKRHLDILVNKDEDTIYYGMFSSLLDSDCSPVRKILILADRECRVQRAVRQEKLSEETAGQLIEHHNLEAACWTRFLFGRNPYSQELYDTVIRYECQDLLDVISYIYMLSEQPPESSIITGGWNSSSPKNLL